MMFSSRRPARSRERTILRLTVEAAERIHPQEHVVYCVVAVCTDGVRRRWRRYSQFHAFHAQLPEARRIPFPGKKWRQQLGFNAVERRRVKLDCFLTELLDTPLTFKSRVELRSFLGLPPPTPPSAPFRRSRTPSFGPRTRTDARAGRWRRSRSSFSACASWCRATS